jgi:hypothetical protein
MGDDVLGELARSGVASEDAGVDVQELHGGAFKVIDECTDVAADTNI